MIDRFKRYKMIHQKATRTGLRPRAIVLLGDLCHDQRGIPKPAKPIQIFGWVLLRLKTNARATGPARCRLADLCSGSEGHADAREPKKDVLVGLADARELGDD
jgi:hypothetical protein